MVHTPLDSWPCRRGSTFTTAPGARQPYVPPEPRPTKPRAPRARAFSSPGSTNRGTTPREYEMSTPSTIEADTSAEQITALRGRIDEIDDVLISLWQER